MQNKDQLFELHKYDLYLFICLLKKTQYILLTSLILPQAREKFVISSLWAGIFKSPPQRCI